MPFRYALFLYHLVFSLIFFGYIMKNGGDSMAYWTLKADISQGAETWMQHFGLNTFFIQWLNYIPSKILGFPFWVGNLLYGLITAYAWMVLYQYVKQLIVNAPTWALKIAFLLPNMHFWTAGVSKESLIWVCLVLFFVNMRFDRKSLIFMVLSILGMFLLRPLYASFLLLVMGIWGLINSPFPNRYNIGALAVLLCLLTLVLWQSFQAIHLTDISLNSLQTYIRFQTQFLGDFQAASYVPMESYSFPLAFFTFFFRPFPWEGEGFWFLMAGIENLLALVLFLAAIILSIWKLYWPKSFLLHGILFLIMLGITGSLVLNNFGIILRYKSIAMIFLYLWTTNTIFSVLKLILAKQINK